MTSDDEIDELKALGEVSVADEGGTRYLLIKELVLPPGCNPLRVDALLCPSRRDGYESRLFFASRVQSSTPRNWNTEAHILGRNWYAFSWRLNAQGLRLAQMVAEHLRALR